MRTGSLIYLLVQKCLRVSISRGKPSIYFLLSIGYVVYVVYVVYVAVVHDAITRGKEPACEQSRNITAEIC